MNDVIANRVFKFEDMKDPGSFMWDEFNGKPARITFKCPCGCGQFGGVKVGDDGTLTPAWEWNNDLDKPTIMPSIIFRSGCGWHGYLNAGIFKTC